MLTELSGYVIGSITGLLLLAGLLFLVTRRRAPPKEESLLTQYVLHAVNSVAGTRQRANRFVLYAVISVVLAGLVLAISPQSTQTTRLAQIVFPWLIVVYVLLALLGVVRWLRKR